MLQQIYSHVSTSG